MIRRREQIVALINEEGQISFSKLKESFPDISDMTLRTDLKYLDEMGKVIRIHGGARSVETLAGTDGLYLARATRKQSEKLEIAQKAVNLLPHNATLFIDSGSTTTLFVVRFRMQPMKYIPVVSVVQQNYPDCHSQKCIY